MAEGSACSILADDGSRSKQARRDVIAPQGREVRAWVELGEYAQKQGTQQIAGGMGAFACAAKRRVGDQLLESSSGAQILREKYQRNQGVYRLSRNVLRNKTPTGRVHDPRLVSVARTRLAVEMFRPTHRVNFNWREWCRYHPTKQSYQEFFRTFLSPYSVDTFSAFWTVRNITS